MGYYDEETYQDQVESDKAKEKTILILGVIGGLSFAATTGALAGPAGLPAWGAILIGLGAGIVVTGMAVAGFAAAVGIGIGISKLVKHWRTPKTQEQTENNVQMQTQLERQPLKAVEKKTQKTHFNLLQALHIKKKTEPGVETEEMDCEDEKHYSKSLG